ncbi:MAG: hypothetical protein LBC75_12040 [Fibromonadaceae bacterium]|jgi:hypothetical protein|nr:hypothetical protein [Fibromonadaceae bacterium]
MNKKILVLAFVSAAFFFGCSADNFISVANVPEPPEWDGVPSPENPSNAGGGYCIAGGMCIKLNSYFTAYECLENNAKIVDICP